jgi:hypothetical protein
MDKQEFKEILELREIQDYKVTRELASKGTRASRA